MNESIPNDLFHAPQFTGAFEASLREPSAPDDPTATEPWARGLLADAKLARVGHPSRSADRRGPHPLPH